MPPAIPAHLGQAKKRLEVSHKAYGYKPPQAKADYQAELQKVADVQQRKTYEGEMQRLDGQRAKAMGTHNAMEGPLRQANTPVQRTNTQYGQKAWGGRATYGANPRAGQTFTAFNKGNREYHRYSNGTTVALPPQQENDFRQLASAVAQSKGRSNLPMKRRIKL